MKTRTPISKWMLTAILLMALPGCSGDDGPPPPTTLELLAHKWVFVKVEDRTTNPPSVSIAGECSKKGYLIFLEDGSLIEETFFEDPNTNICTSNGLNSYSYELTQDENGIMVTFGGSPPTTETWQLISLTEAEMVITTPSIPDAHIFLERIP